MTAPLEPDHAFETLLNAEWHWRLREFPRLATLNGLTEHNHRMERMDAESRARRLAHWRQVRAQLDALDTTQLSAPNRVNAAVLAHQLDTQIDEHALGGVLMPIDADQAFYSYLPELWRDQPLDHAEQVEAYLLRLQAVAVYLDDHHSLLEDGLRAGRVQPALVLAGREGPVRRMAACARAEETPFWTPLTEPLRRHPHLAALAREAIEGHLLPAYRRLLQFLETRYWPAARSGPAVGASAMPEGDAFYAARVRNFSTLPLTPHQVHELGRTEVERIRHDMATLQVACGEAGPSLPSFLRALQVDPRFIPTSGEALLNAASGICKRVDAVLPRFFGHLPRQPFGVEPVPESFAPHYTAGRYLAAPKGQAALYWVNTHNLASRSLLQLPALTLHEAVPGHHLQFALELENESLHPFRRAGDLSAHSEGWALYAEYLGREMGIYRSPFEELGRASYEMWRACRLVIDTGLHALGWTREQAQAFLRDHTALSEHEVRTEVDRYIGWPGQALSYKLGEVHIRRLRAEHEAALGTRFSLRDFHDRLLALGTVPLGCLAAELKPQP
ncbi:DUF885 domain-containing protein [Inhella gelatinilytica]|uniref:DUF885 domain-containing protein n=1 Tax=Inhella gelatinilytica TaxID=2795030 RepID=A0A931IX20_9BURK|nr:DUF885 domain-containing protein [Inhella gelatinilytica]MBH9551446.1 DUF885 domain-containing protein [Inhella gelatinilytica]